MVGDFSRAILDLCQKVVTEFRGLKHPDPLDGEEGSFSQWVRSCGESPLLQRVEAARHLHKAVQRLHRVSLRCVFVSNYIGSSLLRPVDASNPFSLFVSSIAMTRHRVDIVELLHALGVCSSYASAFKSHDISNSKGAAARAAGVKFLVKDADNEKYVLM